MVCRFELASLESSFAKAHASAHLTSDALGFAFAMAWTAAATVRTKLAGGSGFLACSPYAALAAAVAVAAAVHSLRRGAYLQWRAAILATLRLLAVAAGVTLNFQVAGLDNARLETVSLAAVVLPLHFVQLTLLPLVWRLRARQHLVLNLASLAAVAACNARLASLALTQPAAAGLLASPSAEFLLIVAWLATQVVCGFLVPTAAIVNEERSSRDRFLNAYVLHCAEAFAAGSLRLGVPRNVSLPTATQRAIDVAVALVPRSRPTPAQIIRTVNSAIAKGGGAVCLAECPTRASAACGSAADEFGSISTHGSRSVDWRAAARAAVAQHRAQQQCSSSEHPAMRHQGSTFSLALAIMDRKPLCSLQ